MKHVLVGCHAITTIVTMAVMRGGGSPKQQLTLGCPPAVGIPIRTIPTEPNNDHDLQYVLAFYSCFAWGGM